MIEESNRKEALTGDWSRRRFIGTAGAGLVGMSMFSIGKGWAQGTPNDRIRHAVIGTGSRGRGHVNEFKEAAGCEVVAICDVDPKRLAQAGEMVPNAKQYADFRKLLEDDSIDSVSIATADHWHVPVALAALQAGKHVYCEKPCSHNVHEANLLAKAARHFGKCVQHGTQRRSKGDHQAAVQALRDGIIGKVYMAKAINHQHRGPIGRAPVEEPPPGVNYDMWTGAAPLKPFTKNRWHYEWHWNWDFGSGDLGNDGSHQLDVAIWGMGVDYPTEVVCSGGQYYYDDDHQTPDHQTIVYNYPNCSIIYEMRLFTPYKLEGHDNGNIFYGTEGSMSFGRRGVAVTMKDGEEKQITGDAPEGSGDIMLNFLHAVRHNDPSKLDAPITTVGAPVTIHCHLGNIGTRLGNQKVVYDPATEKITACGGREAEANALLTREYRTGYELPWQG